MSTKAKSIVLFVSLCVAEVVLTVITALVNHAGLVATFRNYSWHLISGMVGAATLSIGYFLFADSPKKPKRSTLFAIAGISAAILILVIVLVYLG